MKSGLGDRNNRRRAGRLPRPTRLVSMKSGLGDRNNEAVPHLVLAFLDVSMESGLEDRNNHRRAARQDAGVDVSMKSGLGDRNNPGQRINWIIPTRASQ